MEIESFSWEKRKKLNIYVFLTQLLEPLTTPEPAPLH